MSEGVSVMTIGGRPMEGLPFPDQAPGSVYEQAIKKWAASLGVKSAKDIDASYEARCLLKATFHDLSENYPLILILMVPITSARIGDAIEGRPYYYCGQS